jgi:hypothetical protein
MHLHALQKVKCGVDAWLLKQSHFFSITNFSSGKGEKREGTINVYL